MCSLSDHMESQIFFYGSYSGEQLDVVERILHVDSVFIDVGANLGEFSIAAALKVTDGMVISVEPSAESRHRLVENIRLNGFSSVHIVPYALGSQEGERLLYDTDETWCDGTRNAGLKSVYSRSDLSCVAETIRERRLDNVLNEMGVRRVDLVKIDAEGAEWSILRGSVDILTRVRPILLFEVNLKTIAAAGYKAEDMLHWIEGFGYRLERITSSGDSVPFEVNQLRSYQNLVAYPT